MIRMRTIALVSSLLLALAASGCGAAAPPPTGAASPDSPEKEARARGDGATRPGGGSVDMKEAQGGAGEETRAPGAPPPPPRDPVAVPGDPGKGKAPNQAVVDSSSASLTGGRLTQQEIGDILTKNAALFNDCYTIGAGKTQSFTGVVTVRATVGPSGNVTDAQVVKSTAKNPKVDTCVVQAFKNIKFPPPKDAGTSVITFPMEFNGVEQVK